MWVGNYLEIVIIWATRCSPGQGIKNVGPANPWSFPQPFLRVPNNILRKIKYLNLAYIKSSEKQDIYLHQFPFFLMSLTLILKRKALKKINWCGFQRLIVAHTNRTIWCTSIMKSAVKECDITFAVDLLQLESSKLNDRRFLLWVRAQLFFLLLEYNPLEYRMSLCVLKIPCGSCHETLTPHD